MRGRVHRHRIVEKAGAFIDGQHQVAPEHIIMPAAQPMFDHPVKKAHEYIARQGPDDAAHFASFTRNR